MAEVRVIEVIETNLLRRGSGVDGDPIRIITQYWSTDGELLAEVDPHKENSDGNGPISRSRKSGVEPVV